MSATIRHELLVEGAIEARAYQLSALDHCLSGSTLLVLPTGMGKTPIEVMVIAERLRIDSGRAIMLAPTNALVNQHLEDLRNLLKLRADEDIVGLTGSVQPSKRREIWKKSKVIVATPQVVRNDVQNGVTNLADVSVLVVDEAHRATGNHAMAQVGDLYAEQNVDGLVVAATASPGHLETEINEVCNRLRIVNIHARPPGDALLAPYATGLEINDVIVEVPEELREMVKPLEIWLSRIIDRLRRLGFYTRNGHVTAGGLQESQKRISTSISRGESFGYRAAKENGIAMRLNNLISSILCQGVAASRETLSRIGNSDEQSKSAREFIADPRIVRLKEELEGMSELHSKVTMVRRMVRRQLKQNPESRVIVFANYRDTVDEISRVLEEVSGVRPQRFVGQASRDGSTGMSQKLQIESLDAFRSGVANVLVATSVGEEGLDVPNADLVIFYEPVGSEIRTIQRRGRTGRQRAGTVHVLIAKDTRDEGARASAKYRENRMFRSIQQVRRKRGTSTIKSEGTYLDSFSVLGSPSAAEFLREESNRLAPVLDDTTTHVDGKKTESQIDPVTTEIEPRRLRPSGQIGLDSYPSEEKPERLIDENQIIDTETIVESLELDLSNVTFDGVAVTVCENLEGTALVARLKQNGLIINLENLEQGDLRMAGDVLVELKSTGDFVESLAQGRLLEQVSKLVNSSSRSIIIVEGNDLFMHQTVSGEAIMGAVSTLTLDYGVPVITSASTEETARFIAISARRETKMIEQLSTKAQERLTSNNGRE